MKYIVLCADDYGQNSAISQAIIELIKKNRLSAVSCMANSYRWPSHAKWLEPFKAQVDIGLHFNLTEGKLQAKGLDYYTIPQLISRAYVRKLNQAHIEAEVHGQLDQFVAAMGQNPDFIDGHQHIQNLPIVRDALLSVYQRRLKGSGCYIRSVKNIRSLFNPLDSGYLKIWVIQLSGAFALNKLLVENGIPHNTSFAGFYDFKDVRKFPKLFRGFLRRVQNKGLIMCHPGLSVESEEDPIAESRVLEFQYLSSDQFLADCAKYQVEIKRFKDL